MHLKCKIFIHASDYIHLQTLEAFTGILKSKFKTFVIWQSGSPDQAFEVDLQKKQ